MASTNKKIGQDTGNKKKQVSDEKDQFLSTADKVVETIKPYAKPIIIVTAVTLIGGALWAGYNWKQNKNAEKGTSAIIAAMEPLRNPTPPIEDDDKTPEEKLLEALRGAKGPISDAELNGVRYVLEASALFRGKKYEEAAATWAKAANSLSGSLRTQAWVAQALALEAAGGDKSKSVALLQKSLGSQKPSAVPDVAIHLARLYAEQGKIDKAKPILEELANSDEKDDTPQQFGFMQPTTQVPGQAEFMLLAIEDGGDLPWLLPEEVKNRVLSDAEDKTNSEQPASESLPTPSDEQIRSALEEATKTEATKTEATKTEATKTEATNNSSASPNDGTANGASDTSAEAKDEAQ